jgi:hypothetical protein
MGAGTIGDLIASGYTQSLEEFVDARRSPLLVGVGILDARLTSRPEGRHSTLTLSLSTDGHADGPQGGAPVRHHLLGLLFPLESRDRRPWARLSLGRSAENDIVLDDPAVSEYHGYVKARGGEVFLGDLGSTNGTLVNGEALRPPRTHSLRSEDIVTLGRCSFQYFTPADLYVYLSLGAS